MQRFASVVALVVACSRPAAREEPSVRVGEAGASIHVIDAPAAVGPDAAPDAAPPAVTVVEAPMKWSAERERLTLEYRRQHSDPAATDVAIEPRVIILHYTAGSSAKGTLGYFDNLRIEASRPELARAGVVNVSAHYVVDRDGTIYRAQPETRFARHCIGLNHIAIGIENVGDENRWPLTAAQVAANVALVRSLAARFPITHLLGHHEAMQFRGHAYYVELDPKYQNDKPDPGAAFMKRVRDRLADLALSGL